MMKVKSRSLNGGLERERVRNKRKKGGVSAKSHTSTGTKKKNWCAYVLFIVGKGSRSTKREGRMLRIHEI